MWLISLRVAVVSILLPSISVALYTTGLGVFGFIAVAGLSGHLAERLRRADASLEQTSTQLADLQAFNQHVIESLTSGLATTNPLGQILTFNPTAERIIGWSAADAVGRDISALLPLPDDTGERRTDAPPRRPEIEVLYTHPSGATREIAVTLAPLLTPSGQGGRLIVFDDVTEKRHLERASRLQQRLAAGIAHEIRNPLASMSGSIQILRHDLPLNAEQKRLMDIVLRESARDLSTTPSARSSPTRALDASSPSDSILPAWSARRHFCFAMTPHSGSGTISTWSITGRTRVNAIAGWPLRSWTSSHACAR